MLGKRVLTAVLGIPILLVLIYVGGWMMVAGLAILATIQILEVRNMMRTAGVGFFPAFAAAAVWAFFVAVEVDRGAGVVVALAFFATGVASLWTADREGFLGLFVTLWTAIYVGWFFAFFVAIRNLVHGRFLAYAVIVVIWSTDTAAYFVGRKFGRHRLSARVSPGKTWEGSIGGAVGGVVAGAVLASIGSAPLWVGIAAGLGISVAGQVGDLVESNLKRFAGVKDSGSVLPGHGGMLDRFDSALMALPLAYYLLRGLGIS